MRSHIGISYLAGGQPTGEPWFINEVDAHPGVEESWDKISAGLIAVYSAITTGGAAIAGLIKPLTDILSGSDVAVQRNAEHWFGDRGTVGNLPTPVDVVDFWFRAWSEDDFDPKPTARIDPADPNIQDLGERQFQRGDDHWYEHGFRFPVRAVPDGKYVLGGAAKDDGWFFDVAVASTVVINIIPDPKAQADFGPIRVLGKAGMMPKTMNADQRLARITSLDAARRALP
jgi:hypothetical protein